MFVIRQFDISYKKHPFPQSEVALMEIKPMSFIRQLLDSPILKAH